MAVGHQIIFLFLAMCVAGVFSNLVGKSPEPRIANFIPNMAVVAGSDVSLPCTVDSLGKYKVAWLRADRQEVLTIGYHVITSDPRFQLTQKGFRTWTLKITNVSLSDSGQYRCEVNTDPMKELVVVVQVVVAPIMEIQKQMEGAVIGEDVILECNVESNPRPITYWTLGDNGTLITSNDKYRVAHKRVPTNTGVHKTKMRLVIKNIQSDDFGSYKCVAWNSVGEEEGTITLWEKPDAQSTTYPSIDGLTSTEAAEIPKPSFSTYPSRDNSATTTAKFPPKIRIRKGQVGANIGTDVTLKCVLKSNPKSVTYWTRGGEGPMLIPSSKYSSTLTDKGVNKVQMKLTVKNLGPEDFGSYKCVAKNSLGEAEGTITLNEIPQSTATPSIDIHASNSPETAPIIQTPHQLVRGAIGEDVTLVCNVESYPKSMVYWKRDDGWHMFIHQVNTKYISTVIDTGTNKVQMRMVIKNLSPDDFGTYACVAKNSLGEIKERITVHEIPKPQSTTYPSRDDLASRTDEIPPNIQIPKQVVGEAIGEDVTLVCNLESNPPAVTYWRLEGGEAMIIASTKYSITRIGKGIHKVQMRLTISNLHPDDFGSYTCVAKNPAGEAEGTISLSEIPKLQSTTYLSRDVLASSSAEIPPNIQIPHRRVEAAIGEDVTFVCNLESYPKSVTYWKGEDGAFMIINSIKYRSSLTDKGAHKVQMTLTIKDIGPDDFGSYKCVAKNSLGEAEGTITLIEILKPQSASNLSRDSLASSTAENIYGSRTELS